MTDQPAHLAANIERFMGFADRYDAYRPRPPLAVIDLLTSLAQVARPALVADIGCGTGLSTLIWADRADAVVGIEPSDDMRTQAEARAADLGNVRFQRGLSTATGLPDGCADIVTASQALHWMEPAPTFAEVRRVLRPGGVFAAYDCDWPPTLHWEAELAYTRCLARANDVEREQGTSRDVRSWDKREHLQRMRDSGQFRYTKEVTLHHVEEGGAERLVGLAMSQGQIAALLKHGLSEAEIGLDELRRETRRVLGDATVPWYWSYRVRLGIV